jgi:hypothetical protein
MTTHTIRFATAGVLLGSLLYLATPLITHAFYGQAFGGKVISVTPCLGVGFVSVEILKASGGIMNVDAYPSPFLYFMMDHPGQSVLGLLSAPAFCLQDWDTGFGISGTGAFFYGTSL